MSKFGKVCVPGVVLALVAAAAPVGRRSDASDAASVLGHGSWDVLARIRGGDNRVCSDQDQMCTAVVKGNECPTGHVCASSGVSRESIASDVCRDPNDHCTSDVMVYAKYCILWGTGCNDIGTAVCGNMNSGQCQYTSFPTQNNCPDGSQYIICQKTCKLTGPQPCYVDLCH